MTTAVDLFAGVGWGAACADLGIDEHGIDSCPNDLPTKRARWSVIGNAVCPPVGRAVLGALIGADDAMETA